MFAHNANMSRRLQKVFALKYWMVQRRTEATAMYSSCIDISLQNVPAERITAVFDSIHTNVCDYAHRHAFVVDATRFNWQEWEPMEQDKEPEMDTMEQELTIPEQFMPETINDIPLPMSHRMERVYYDMDIDAEWAIYGIWHCAAIRRACWRARDNRLA